MGFPCGSAGKESACNAGDLGFILGLGRSPGEGKGYLLQYSGLENSMDCTVLGVAKSQTRLSNFHFQCIYTESRKMVLKNLFAGQQWRNRHREQTHGHGERGGEGAMYGESNMEIYITICKIDSQWEFAV